MFISAFQFYNLVPNLTAKENVELAEIVKDAQDAEEALKASRILDTASIPFQQLSV